MDAPIMGMIVPLAFNFAPMGWFQCQGQVISIAQNSALFALFGTTYGGDGQQTFALPDLRGRAIVGQGQSQGMSLYTWGETGGTESATMLTSNMPAHSHLVQVKANSLGGGQSDPTNNFLGGGTNIYESTSDASMNQSSVVDSLTGGSQPFNILNPYLALNYCVCSEGMFPSRN